MKKLPGRKPHASLGATLVEFALIAPLFFAMVFAAIGGGWYVLEVSSLTNATRNAVRWEIATANFAQMSNGVIVDSNGVMEPYCAATPPANTPPALIQEAQKAVGPFASLITPAAITNTPMYQTPGNSNSAVIGCTMNLTVHYQPIEPLVPIGSNTISVTFNERID